MPESLLSSRASAVLSALIVTWVAVALLLVVVGNLHVRLRRLESRDGTSPGTAPYAGLIGRDLGPLLGNETDLAPYRILLFVSSSCGSCRRLLHEFAAAEVPVPVVLAWVDAQPPGAELRPGVRSLPDGPRVAAALGIRVTPFVLLIDESGRITKAAPVSGLAGLAGLTGNLIAAPRRGPDQLARLERK